MANACANIENIDNRTREKRQLLNSLRNSVNTFVFGRNGIGKTTLINTVIEEYNSKFGQAVYIDCLLYQTANAILREVLFSLGSVILSRSNYELIKRLKKKAKKLKLVVILDHFENLKENEALKVLIALDFCVCLVSDSFRNYKGMNLILRSKITNILKVTEFSRYQVLKIIKEKMNSFTKVLLDNDILQRIVEKSGSNITFALNLLKTIATNTNKKNENPIDYLSFFEDAFDETYNEDHRIILQILKKSKRLPSGKIYRLYCEGSDHPKSERSFRKYMQVLCKQGLVKSIGEKKGRTYEILEVKNSRKV